MGEGYVFVSYSRSDGAYVARLVRFLRDNGIAVWWDVDTPDGIRWRRELATRVEQSSAVILVESPQAQESDWVEEEILHAYRRRRPVLVLLLKGDLRFGMQRLQVTSVEGGQMPPLRFIDRVRELAAATMATKEQGRVLVPAEAWQYPGLPIEVVNRPAQVEQTVAALTSGSGTVGLTGVHGGGGLGKTIVARMVVSRREVREAFPGGLLWVDLGQEQRDAALAAVIGDMCAQLGGEQPGPVGPVEAGKALAALLAARPATLVVLDDAWFDDQLQPFLNVDVGPARFLVTTRNTGLLTDAVAISVDTLDEDQARAVLLRDLPQLPAEPVGRLVKATGGWALVVNTANAQMRRAVRHGSDPAAYAGWLADTLTAEGLGALDVRDARSRENFFAASMRPSLAMLDAQQRRRTLELAVFAEDADIELNLLALLWRATGGLTPRQTRRLATELKDLNLLTEFRAEAGVLRLHDLVRAHLAGQLGTDGLWAVHGMLLDAAARRYSLEASLAAERTWWHLPASAEYLWRHLVDHLRGAGRETELVRLVTDLRWTQAKLLVTGAAALDADLATVSSDSTAAALRATLTRESHVLGPVIPAHSYGDILASRIDTDPALVGVVERFRATLPGRVMRLRPGWVPPDAADPAIRRVITGHTSGVNGVAVAPDGSWLATASWDGTIRLWDAATGAARATLTGHAAGKRDGVLAVAVAPDGTWLASGGTDTTVRLWDAATGAAKATLVGHTDWVNAVAIAPSGMWLASGDNNGTIRLWDAATGAAGVTLTGHIAKNGGGVTSIAVAPDGTWLASVGSDGTVRTWDTTTGTERAALTGHAGRLNGVVVAPDGTWLATAGHSDHAVRLWDTATGAMRATLTGHTKPVTAVAVALDGTWLASASWDGTVRVWDVSTGAARATLTGHATALLQGGVNDVVVAPDGTWLASAGWDETVRVWDTATAEARTTPTGHTGDVPGVVVAPDGTWLATAGDDGTVRLWDAITGKEQATLTGHTRGVWAVAVAPDGRWLASASKDRTVRLWDMTTGKEQATLTGHTQEVNAVAVAPDGSWLATASHDNTVRLWDVASGAERLTLKVIAGGYAAGVDGVALAVAPDGSWLATVSGISPRLQLWDTITGREIRTVLTGRAGIDGVAVAPDGSWLATAGLEGVVKRWDVATGAHLATLAGHTGRVRRVAIAGDGARIAGVATDGTLRLWDVATDANIATMRAAGPLRAVCWAPVGQIIYASGQFGPYRFDLI